MRIDTVQLFEGSRVVNLTVDHGAAFPGDANEGELFFLTTDDQLYYYNGAIWVSVSESGGASYPDQTAFDGHFLVTNGVDVAWAQEVDSLGVGTPASGVVGEIRATHQVQAYYTSDVRLKENITPIPNALEKVQQINGVTYDWTDEYIADHGGEDGFFIRKRDVGVIAQQIESILPEIVAENNAGYKVVKYERLVALLIESTKELSAKCAALDKEIKDLHRRLDSERW